MTKAKSKPLAEEPIFEGEVKPRGRPSIWSQEVADEILDRVSNGEPLAQVCREVDKPAYRTIVLWRHNRPEFNAAYMHARDVGYDAIAERARQTARGYTLEEGGDSKGDVQRDKLIIETDLRLLGKWHPTKYGDKLNLNHEGEVTANLRIISPRDRAKAMAALVAKQVAAK